MLNNAIRESGYLAKGVGRKFPRGRGNVKKRPKIAKVAKIALFKPLPRGRGDNEKKTENSKKDRKTSLLSLYLLYLYHI